VHWVDGCRRRAPIVVVAALALTAACGYYAATNLGIQTNSDALLSHDLPYRKTHLEFTRAFPMLSDNLVILVDAPTADQAEDAARKLGARLKDEPDHFNLVFYPDSEPFFRTNGLLLLSRKDLQETADQLADAQPLLSKLAADMSLRGYFNVLGLAADEIAKGTEKPGRLARPGSTALRPPATMSPPVAETVPGPCPRAPRAREARDLFGARRPPIARRAPVHDVQDRLDLQHAAYQPRRAADTAILVQILQSRHDKVSADARDQGL
jgi:hypothetical protein